jgi:hypothetical protein
MNAAGRIEGDFALRWPLEAGGQVVYWRLGATSEQRYDVPDQPMKGDMDPFFFLTKHKNFIPHEYPCRTQFASERRSKRPEPEIAFEPRRVWLPFGSPRVDLSGFWFRPTVLGTWAQNAVVTREAGRARLRLRTCGGAVLFVNGAEIGWMAPYGRNLEAASEFEVELVAGANDLRIWFDDLAERDARYYFQLDYLSGPAGEQAIHASVPTDVAVAMENALEAMHFERPAYSGGEVALVTGAPLPVAVEVAIEVEGDFMSIEEPVSSGHGWRLARVVFRSPWRRNCRPISGISGFRSLHLASLYHASSVSRSATPTDRVRRLRLSRSGSSRRWTKYPITPRATPCGRWLG